MIFSGAVKTEVTPSKDPVAKQLKETSDVKTEVVRVQQEPAPWRHSVKLGQEFRPESIKVFVRDGRVRIQAEREGSENLGEFTEFVEISRELRPPSDVNLEEIVVFFRPEGVLDLEAPRVRPASPQPQVTSAMGNISVNDIEHDAGNTDVKDAKDDENMKELNQDEDTTTQENKDNVEETMEIQEENTEDKTKDVVPDVENDIVAESDVIENEGCEKCQENRAEVEDEKEKEEQAQEGSDWEMLNVEENKDTEGNSDNKTVAENLEEAANDESHEKEGDNIDISVVSEVVEEKPKEVKDVKEDAIETSIEDKKLVIQVVSDEQQEVQQEINSTLMVMNLSGFEPRDVEVKKQDGRLTVLARKEVEEDGFLNRKESFRSFRLPQEVTPSHVICTMAPSGNLVITHPKQQ